jgi:hypothetical protein
VPPKATFMSCIPRHVARTQIARERRSHKRDLARVSPRISRSRFALCGIPVGARIDVAAARQDERVDPVERQRRISRQHAGGRQHDRGGARPFHSLYVVIVQEERPTRPRSPPRLRTPHRQAHNRHRSTHRHSMTRLPPGSLSVTRILGPQPSPRNEPITPATRSGRGVVRQHGRGRRVVRRVRRRARRRAPRSRAAGAVGSPPISSRVGTAMAE